MSNTLRIFKIVAFAEGISYLLLFALSMPLKYIFGINEPNLIIGMAHGLLFSLYCLLLLILVFELKWTFAKAALIFLASLVPFGTFIADKRLFNTKTGIR
jgi:integral membrane protein